MYISQRFSRCVQGVAGSLTTVSLTVTAEFECERILKIGQHLAKLWARVGCLPCFFNSRGTCRPTPGFLLTTVLKGRGSRAWCSPCRSSPRLHLLYCWLCISNSVLTRDDSIWILSPSILCVNPMINRVASSTTAPQSVRSAYSACCVLCLSLSLSVQLTTDSS